ncbi:hypothetical protein SAMN02745225_01388 [Ferrithrix thermotolerans DSM 19514]|jgi:hypothetical protein|uniref:DUF501 domain-containing protein n=1 Tax=Ferrithrix thermotolerans DSM 19514 TaxID=1121881 RepID=A0A1M4VPZ3_9ACTN|nr:DUF501 domain-containing protein [Ferrithrix thermotolerans]SHE70917.1 hypothetical protein SAMN02745225_01388 [Ferrithrix thermotolerans DSM 19514]
MDFEIPAAFVSSEREGSEVGELIGRAPTIPFRVALRSEKGRALVIESFPIRPSGYPNPDWFWLVDRDLIRAVGRLESQGGVSEAERVFSSVLPSIHNAYRAGRNSLVAHYGDRYLAAGGVGGAKNGVKCLHSHLAYYLVGGFNPVGEWVAKKISLNP